MHMLHDPWRLTFWTSTSRSGHEFPFSIKMSHIRDGGSSGGGLGGGPGRDTTSPTDCPGVLLLDQCLPPDTQCQFILKPNKAAPGPFIGKSCSGQSNTQMLHACNQEMVQYAAAIHVGQQWPFQKRKSWNCCKWNVKNRHKVMKSERPKYVPWQRAVKNR